MADSAAPSLPTQTAHFEPETETALWLDPGLICAAVLIGVVMLTWWKSLPWIACLFTAPLAVGLVLVRWHYERRHRGTLTLFPAGVRVVTRAGAFEAAWQSIHRVHRLKGQLIFETVAPHRRHTLAMSSHWDQRAIVDALAKHGRMLDLRWVEGLGRALGDD